VEFLYLVQDSLFTAYDNEKSWGIAQRIMKPHVIQEATDAAFNDMTEVVPDLVKEWSSGTKQRVKATDGLDLLLLTSCNQCFF
jgi:hypothetical protein